MGTFKEIFKLIRKLRYSILISFLFCLLSYTTLYSICHIVQKNYESQVRSMVYQEQQSAVIDASKNLFDTISILNGVISLTVSFLYFYINYKKFKAINITKKDFFYHQKELDDLIKEEKEKKHLKDKQEEISFRLNIAHSNSRNLKNVISGVNHEVAPWLGIIRNVSNMMLQFLTLKTQLNGKDFKFIQDKIQEIEASAEQCIYIVDNLSKNIKYLQKYDMNRSNVGSTIKAMVSVALLNSSIRKNIRPSQIEVDYTSLDFLCRHSPMFLHQILMNLVNNAIDHNSHMRDELKIKIYGDSSKKSLYVEDNGKGISSKVMEQLFTPNFTTKDDHVDTHGLGLAMCMDYAISMGAYIDVQSQEGLFTKFIIEFEVSDDETDRKRKYMNGSSSNIYKAYQERKEKAKEFDSVSNSGFLNKVKIEEEKEYEAKTDMPWMP